LLGGGELLGRDCDLRHGDLGRVFFPPFDCGILDGHFRGVLAKLDQEIKARFALGEMFLHVFAQEIRGRCLDERRGVTTGARREHHRGVAAEEIRCHAPVSVVQRVGNFRAPDRVGDSELVQTEIKRIQPGKKELDGAAFRKGLLKLNVVCRVPHEKNRMVDHNKVLCAGLAMLDSHELDGHPSAIADRIVLHLSGTVGVADPRRVGAGLHEDPDPNFLGQIVENAKLRLRTAVGLGVGVSASQTILGFGPDGLLDHLHDLMGRRVLDTRDPGREGRT
jgi:hypothetical protein